MKCPQALDLIPEAAFEREGDLLDPETRAAFKRHVDACPSCFDDERALERVLSAWTRVTARDAVPLSGGLRERVTSGAASPYAIGDALLSSASLLLGKSGKKDATRTALAEADAAESEADPPEVRLVAPERAPATCAYCHGYAAGRDRVLCKTCRAPHHLGCFRGHGACSTLGCESTRFLRPASAAEPPAPASEAGPRPAPAWLIAAASLLISVPVAAWAHSLGLRAIQREGSQAAAQRVQSEVERLRPRLTDPKLSESERRFRQPHVLQAAVDELARDPDVVFAAVVRRGSLGTQVFLHASQDVTHASMQTTPLSGASQEEGGAEVTRGRLTLHGTTTPVFRADARIPELSQSGQDALLSAFCKPPEQRGPLLQLRAALALGILALWALTFLSAKAWARPRSAPPPLEA